MVVAHFIVNTLSFLRSFHFRWTDREDAKHTYDGLILSFEWFDGVPEEVLVDNQRAAVLVHPRGDLPAFLHGLWIWRATMGLCRAPAGPPERRPTGKMSGWSATSGTTSLCVTEHSIVGCI